MQVTKFKDAKRYEAANHFDVSALRLQGQEATKTSTFWTGLSHYLPGGKAERSASDYERVYICLLYTSPSPRDGLLSRMPSSA